MLPGVDDGPKTMDETEAVLKEAVSQGISTMIVTPHYHPDRYMVSSEQIGHALTSVRRMCAEKGIRITLLPGQECLWHSDLVEALNTGVDIERDSLCSRRIHAVDHIQRHI